MREEVKNPPLMSIRVAAKGFIGGGFMGFAVFAPWDAISRIVLFVIGVIVFLDSLMPSDRVMYVVTSVFSMIVGGLISFFSEISGMEIAYLAVVLIVAALVYMDKIRRMKSFGKR